MASLTCFACPQITPKDHKVGLYGRVDKLYGLRLAEKITKAKRDSSFLGGCRLRIGFTPEVEKHIHSRQTSSGVCCSCMSSSEIVSSAFTLGTAAVLPFYTLMLAAPKAELTKKAMRSSLPYVGLGVLYAYLLWLSWTADTMRLMFASKYWLPELEGIAKMFSSETTLASAWIHLLVVDLFAARQVYEDGLENEVETRHSVALCLLFCPVGIISHVITKRFTNASKTTTENDTEI